jgi:acetyl esterase/lipase
MASSSRSGAAVLETLRHRGSPINTGPRHGDHAWPGGDRRAGQGGPPRQAPKQPALDPALRDLSGLPACVVALHGEADPVVPGTEALARAVPHFSSDAALPR